MIDLVSRDTPGVSHRRRLVVSIGILLFLLVAGTLGFRLLGTKHTMFECLYLTTVILTTVGMKEEAVTLNAAEQAWAIFLMLAGISAAVYATTNLVAFMVEGEIGRMFGRRQLENKINRLKDHFVVCGFGRMGRALCETLAQRGAAFVLIEHDTEQVAEAESLGFLCIRGDAMSEETLNKARLEYARGLASCLRNDADNVFVTLTARGMNPSLTIIARSEERATEMKLQRAGASRVICTPLLGATKISQMLLTPAVDELLDIAVAGPDIEISKLRLRELPGAVGRSLRELDLRVKTGLMVVAVVQKTGDRAFNPPPDSQLRAGDEMIVVGPPGSVAKMVELYGTKDPARA